ncbi:hypothetical protein TNIN_434661 [Trichonephila inaurata madagascariensis]|uniref:Uncharacterized protein n=1 Tax=Trichonephila inaurata madagascariensis TaxID=2747483 RepID=A0A8X6XKB6_9ARAC|nr:hypothetical protein TNIN_434661 [Trichonephila inaurata madagascariensis]
MDDNTLIYQAYEESEYLQIEDITRKNWPSYSTDLNPIEHEPNSFPDTPGVEKIRTEPKQNLSTDGQHFPFRSQLSLASVCPVTVTVGR